MDTGDKKDDIILEAGALVGNEGEPNEGEPIGVAMEAPAPPVDFEQLVKNIGASLGKEVDNIGKDFASVDISEIKAVIFEAKQLSQKEVADFLIKAEEISKN
jgi:hypothetical protein